MSEVLPLEPGERLLWTGRPDPIGYFIWKGRSPLILGLICLAVWLVLVLGLIPTSVIREQRQFGVAILLLGGMNLVLTLYFYVKGSYLTYAITDRRAIVAWHIFSAEYSELPFDRFAGVGVLAAADGRGHVLFLATSRLVMTFWRRPAEGFFAVADPDIVGRTLSAAIKQATGRTVGKT